MSIVYFFFFFWFVLEIHESAVEGTASESHPAFWGVHNTGNASLLEGRLENVREEEAQQRHANEEEEKERSGIAECESELGVCPGHRPRSSGNCTCHAQAWDECNDDIGKVCDEQLGLQCINNTCVGSYHLKIMLITRNSVDLIWDDFKPTDYLYEYVLLRSARFSTDLRFWRNEAVGNEPETSVTSLLANHGYFFRVATWEDPNAGKYGIISEAVFVKTKAGCLRGGRWFDVDEMFSVKCEETCRCLANGTFACKQICPEEKPIPEMKNPDFKCFKELINTSGCCYKIVCVPIDASNCVHENRTYKSGDFWRQNCDQQCACVDGSVKCLPICKTKAEHIRTEKCFSEDQNHDRGAGCCPVIDCLPKDGCVFKKRKLKVGQVIRESCKNYCECGSTGVSCRPVCPQIREKPRGNCLTTRLPFDCCLSWICRPERRPYSAISASASFELKGTCHSSGRRELADDVINAIRTRAEEGSGRLCSSGGALTGCVAIHVQVRCVNATGNDADHAHYILSYLKWTVARKGSRAIDAIDKELKTFVKDIGRVFVAKDFRIFLHGMSYGPARNWYLSSLTKECDKGYKKTHYDCVPKPVFRLKVGSYDQSSGSFTTSPETWTTTASNFNS